MQNPANPGNFPENFSSKNFLTAYITNIGHLSLYRQNVNVIINIFIYTNGLSLISNQS